MIAARPLNPLTARAPQAAAVEPADAGDPLRVLAQAYRRTSSLGVHGSSTACIVMLNGHGKVRAPDGSFHCLFSTIVMLNGHGKVRAWGARMKSARLSRPAHPSSDGSIHCLVSTMRHAATPLRSVSPPLRLL